MRAPSSKKLVEAFRDLDTKEANLIRKFAKAVDDRDDLEDLVDEYPAAAAYVRSLQTIPYPVRSGRLNVVLHAIDKLIEGHGVESLGERYDYVNMGDQYATTLIYDSDQDRLFLGTWEDVTERPGFEWEREENPRTIQTDSYNRAVLRRGKEKDVIVAFTEKRPAQGDVLETDGETLTFQTGLGGGATAWWTDEGKITFAAPGGKLEEAVHRAVRREAPHNWLLNPGREENPPRPWALVKSVGMDDRLMSTHSTKAAAEKAMRKAGGEPDSMFTGGMRIVDVSRNGPYEIIHVQGRGTIRPRRANNPGTTSASDLVGKLKF